MIIWRRSLLLRNFHAIALDGMSLSLSAGACISAIELPIRFAVSCKPAMYG